MLVLFVVLEGMVWHRGLKFSLAAKERRTALTYIYTSDALGRSLLTRLTC